MELIIVLALAGIIPMSVFVIGMGYLIIHHEICLRRNKIDRLALIFTNQDKGVTDGN